MSQSPASPLSTPSDQITVRRVAATSCIGTTLEWYDFFIYSTSAALIFSSQFFPDISGPAQTLAALSTVTVGYVARPLGSIIFGHFGDRLGRKQLLVFSLLLMGAATFATGLLPNYAQAGLWAPLLLVILRFLQGVALGGEWGGAVLMAVEHAPRNRRGLFGTLPQLGAPFGFILSTLVFLVPSLLLSGKDFESWGWRVPFLFSILLVFVGIYLRLKVTESPEFVHMRNREKPRKLPILEVLTTSWRQLLLGLGLGIPLGVAYYIYSGYVLAYGTKEIGADRNELLVAAVIGAVVMGAVLPYAGHLSDRFGRRAICLIGVIAVGAWAFPSFWLVDTGNILLITVAISVGLGCVGLAYGPLAALYAEMFPARMRYSGAGLTYMLMGILGSGMAPLAAPILLGATGTSAAIALYMVVMAALGSVCAIVLVRTTLGREDTALADDAAGKVEIV